MPPILYLRFVFVAFLLLLGTSACQDASKPDLSSSSGSTPKNADAPKNTETKPVVPDTANATILRQGSSVTNIPDSTLAKTEGTNPPEVAGAYEATFPCNDCAGVYHELTLKSDGTYQLSETYQATKKGNDTTTSNGTWKALRRKLVLQDSKYRKVIRFYAVVDDNRLELLSMNGDLLYSRSPEIFQLKRKGI